MMLADNGALIVPQLLLEDEVEGAALGLMGLIGTDRQVSDCFLECGGVIGICALVVL